MFYTELLIDTPYQRFPNYDLRASQAHSMGTVAHKKINKLLCSVSIHT